MRGEAVSRLIVGSRLVVESVFMANQQKDGDSPIQSIVTGLCERSRKGILEGLRNFGEPAERW